jgi:hypothetical protein
MCNGKGMSVCIELFVFSVDPLSLIEILKGKLWPTAILRERHFPLLLRCDQCLCLLIYGSFIDAISGLESRHYGHRDPSR